MIESQELDKKSIAFLGKPNWSELAKDCVSFANSRGGSICIGIENEEDEPKPNQRIRDKRITEKIHKTISQLAVNVSIIPQILKHENGGEYIEIKVLRNNQTIACTTDGKYYARISDECKPVMPDEMARLAADKNAFIWEEQTTRKVPSSRFDEAKRRDFLEGIRSSERVSDFIKDKSDDELLEYYILTRSGYLTNLGILWVGKREDRASLLHAPSIQFIKYNEMEEKVFKKVWDDHSLNPLELLDAVVNEIPDWNESIEVADGIFRKNIPNYNIEVIRELVANALVHRVYTMRGDIFINLFSNRLDIHSPGLLPFGVTPQNIISQSIHRNSHLAKVFYDLKLMEKEGSGYDKIFELLVSNGKPLPKVVEGDDRVTVTILRQIVNKEVVKLMDKANQDFHLKQKELICLGLIAQHNALSAIELTKILNLKEPNGIRQWLGRLPAFDLVLHIGKTRGTEYYINPAYLRKSSYKGRTNLKKIEPHRLKELILQDLFIYTHSSISDIQMRIGKEISLHKIRTALKELSTENKVAKSGELKHTKYFIKKQ